MCWYGVHRVVDVEVSELPPEELLQHRTESSYQQRSPWLYSVAARTNTDVATDEPIHSGNEVEHFSLRLSVADEAIEDTWNWTGKDGVHGYHLWKYVLMYTNLIPSKGHVDEYITDKYQHDAEDGEWKRFCVVVKVLGNVHVVQSNQSIEVFLFYLDISKLPDFTHELLFLLFSQRLVYQNVFNMCSFFWIFIYLILVWFNVLLLT